MKQYIQGLYLHPFDDNIEDYIRELPLLHNLQELSFTKPVTFFVGENGMGKSTLLEAIALQYGFNPEGGSRNLLFSTCDTHSPLANNLRLVRGVDQPKDGFFLRAESFYNVATSIDENEREMSGLLRSYGGKSLHEQSHGESFFALMCNRFYGHGLYILDEPEAALSPNRQLSMLTLMHDLIKEGSQFIIATHSPILMAYPNADIYVCSDCRLALTPYKETDNYQVTKSFLQDPNRYLRYLLED